MSRRAKIAIGAVTALPTIWLFVWVGYMAYAFAKSGPLPAFTAMFIVMAAVVLLNFALVVFYALHAGRNPRVRNDERTMWILLIALAGTFANPVYWFLHVWRESGALQQYGRPLGA